jgi:hypothetical protein
MFVPSSEAGDGAGKDLQDFNWKNIQKKTWNVTSTFFCGSVRFLGES